MEQNLSVVNNINSENIEIDDTDMLSFYSNSVQMQIGLYDLQLAFGYQSPDLKTNKLINKQLAKITMSPQHAKVLANLLNENIRQYEKHFGDINIPNVSK